jgi:hypothetical protein
MNQLKTETVIKFKELYRDYPELIEYRIKSGNIYQKAQATLIKKIAVSDLRASDCLAAPDTCIASHETTLKINQE